jgi:hypothetical protein
MTVPTTIVDALLLAINTGVADVDTVSSNDFAPAITTASVAALSPAFDLETVFAWESLSSIEITVTHRVPIEFWVKHDGKPAQTMQRARNVGASAVTALVLSDGTGYTLAFEEPVSFSVDPGLTTINSVSWLVATMVVTVRDVVSLGD